MRTTANRNAPRLLVTTVMAALATSLLLLSPAEAATKRISISDTTPSYGQTVKISGHIGTTVKRTIKLQRWNGSTWVTKMKTTTRGSFRFTRTANSKRYAYRAYASKKTVYLNGRKKT
ncbi:hypothetical protein [Aeromicrobium sp.]|uniref:hypothetical protein n=1 Tax=Aeromicrobium sp. TaxID=1871063 RepID=UPI0019964589|nr:hypothetical protein [Aeromicrobium sp.]MBC7632092.1 hypothetical protein [Aeromicrobium sp.]